MSSTRLLRIVLGLTAVASLVAAPRARADAYETATECRRTAGMQVCVVVEAVATGVPTRLCPGAPGPGERCYRKIEMGRAYTDAPMSGAADFFGQEAPRRCTWEWSPAGGACEAEVLTVFEFDKARADCFEAWGAARAFVLADSDLWMKTFAAVVSPDCPA